MSTSVSLSGWHGIDGSQRVYAPVAERVVWSIRRQRSTAHFCGVTITSGSPYSANCLYYFFIAHQLRTRRPKQRHHSGDMRRRHRRALVFPKLVSLPEVLGPTPTLGAERFGLSNWRVVGTRARLLKLARTLLMSGRRLPQPRCRWCHSRPTDDGRMGSAHSPEALRRIAEFQIRLELGRNYRAARVSLVEKTSSEPPEMLDISNADLLN